MEQPEAVECAGCGLEANGSLVSGLGPDGCPGCGRRSTIHHGRRNSMWKPIATLRMVRANVPTKDEDGWSKVAAWAVARQRPTGPLAALILEETCWAAVRGDAACGCLACAR